jgi:hypothetical protein
MRIFDQYQAREGENHRKNVDGKQTGASGQFIRSAVGCQWSGGVPVSESVNRQESP